MPSRGPYAPQSYYYQQSRGRGSRPPNHHAYPAPPAGHYYDEQEHYYNDYQRSAYGRPRGAPRYQDRPRYWPPPQGSHQYPVDPRDEEIPEDAYPEDDMYSSIYGGDEVNPGGAYPLSAEGYTPTSHPRSRSDVVASAASTSYASLQSGPPPMKSNNPFLPRKA
jgi:hypothetical protein